MRKIFLLFVVICCSSKTNAQVPGYMNKKLSFGYDFHFYLGGLDENAREFDKYYYNNQPSFFLNTFHEFHLDRVITRSYSIGITYQHFNTGQFYSENKNIYDNSTFEVSYYDANNYLNITGDAFIINNKFFFFNNGTGLAPIGNYGQISVGLVTSSAMAKIKGYINDYYGSTQFSKIVKHDNVFSTIITGGLGNQSIYFDRLILDVGFEIAFLPNALQGWLPALTSSSTTSGANPSKELARDAMLTRLQTFYISSVKVGIGVLLF